MDKAFKALVRRLSRPAPGMVEPTQSVDQEAGRRDELPPADVQLNALTQFARRRGIGAEDSGRQQTYWAEAAFLGITDKNCIIGYEEPMQTYWFQSGREIDDGPAIWLGRSRRELISIPALKRALHQAGVNLLAWELEPGAE